MVFLNKKFRNIVVFIVIIVLCIIVITVSFRNLDFVNNIKSNILDFFKPVQEKVFSAFSPIVGFFNGIRDYINLRGKYLQLQKENAVLRQKYVENINLRIENNSLRELLNLEQKNDYQSITGKVIGYNQSNWQSEIILNIGKNEGVEEGMAVINEYGLLGVVRISGDKTCTARLLNDPQSSIGCRILTSRVLGILEGDPEGNIFLRYVPKNMNIFLGDIIMTSEYSEHIPEGLLAGRVKYIEENMGEAYKEIEVEPFADFKNLEYVMVIKGK